MLTKTQNAVRIDSNGYFHLHCLLIIEVTIIIITFVLWACLFGCYLWWLSMQNQSVTLFVLRISNCLITYMYLLFHCSKSAHSLPKIRRGSKTRAMSSSSSTQSLPGGRQLPRPPYSHRVPDGGSSTTPPSWWGPRLPPMPQNKIPPQRPANKRSWTNRGPSLRLRYGHVLTNSKQQRAHFTGVPPRRHPRRLKKLPKQLEKQISLTD